MREKLKARSGFVIYLLVVLVILSGVATFITMQKYTPNEISDMSRTQINRINITFNPSINDFVKDGHIVGKTIAPGQPELPVLTKKVELDPTADLVSVNMTYKVVEYQSLEDSLALKYSPKITAGDGHAYSGKLPKKPVEIVTTGGFRNEERFVKLAYFPILMNSGHMVFYKKVVVTISWTDEVESSVVRVRGNSPIGYAIITTKDIVSNSKNLSIYVQFLKNQGYNVYVVTEDDYGYAEGQQRAINIRNWLKNNYIDKNIYYVLLIGNPDPDDPSSSTDSYGDVPMMMTWPRAWGYDRSPTDYFYADLTGNWDLDGDGYYGEWGDDTGSGGVDYVADVYVGRIPVYNHEYQVLDNILSRLMKRDGVPNKILMPMAISNYQNEDNKGWDRTDGQKLPYYVGSFTSSYTNVAMYEGKGINPVDSSAAYYTYDIDEYNFTQEWNKGYGYVLWWAHGWHDSAWRKVWTTDDGDNVPESSEMSWYYFVNTNHTLNYLNPENTIVFQVSCLNGFPETKYNLGYAMLEKAALATISATRVSWYRIGTWSPGENPDNAEVSYLTLKNYIENDTGIGDAFYNAKSHLSSSLYWGNESFMNLMDFNIYGPPEIRKNAPNRILKSPIRINNNEEFEKYADIYGWPGDGSTDNPYIVSNCNIDGHGGSYGIYIGNTTVHFVIENCTIYNLTTYVNYYFHGDGITLYNVTNGKIVNNNIHDTLFGMVVRNSHNNAIMKNKNFSGISYYSIEIVYSEFDVFKDNYIGESSDNIAGIAVIYSMHNKFYNNTFQRDGFYIFGNESTFATQDIPDNNTVNGKPVFYLASADYQSTPGTPPLNAGQIILGNVTNFSVNNYNLSSTTIGIEIGYSRNVSVAGGNYSQNKICGVYVEDGENNKISNISALNNGYYGIYMIVSQYNRIESNNLSSNTYQGIALYWSSNNTIDNNTCMFNGNNGIYLNSSSYNQIINNNCSHNLHYHGVSIDWYSNHNKIYHNELSYNYYEGVWIGDGSSYNTVRWNNISHNSYGIFMRSNKTKYNIISNNNITYNTYYGVWIYQSIDNYIYNNSFYYNYGSGDTYDSQHIQARDDGSNNHWNTTGNPHGYGNYWRDWANNNDTNDQKPPYGIVDWPYKIDGSANAKDYYPLKEPANTTIPEIPSYALIPLLIAFLFIIRISKHHRVSK